MIDVAVVAAVNFAVATLRAGGTERSR